MNLLIAFLIFFLIYLAIVRATYLKFKNNGIILHFKNKIVLPFLIFLFYIHKALKLSPSNKKRSLQIVTNAIVKYPIILGGLIEVILESWAEYNVFGKNEYLEIKNMKQVIKKNRVHLDTASLKVKEIIVLLKTNPSYNL